MSVRFRGVPPPPEYDFHKLADKTDLRAFDVAAIRREALSYTERKRREGTDGLQWRIVDKRPRTTVGSLKQAMAAVTTPGNIAPDFRKDKSAAKTKASKPAKRRASAEAMA